MPTPRVPYSFAAAIKMRLSPDTKVIEHIFCSNIGQFQYDIHDAFFAWNERNIEVHSFVRGVTVNIIGKAIKQSEILAELMCTKMAYFKSA